MKKRKRTLYCKILKSSKQPKKKKETCKGLQRENQRRKKVSYYKCYGDVNRGYLAGTLSPVHKTTETCDGKSYIQTEIHVARTSKAVDVIPVLFTKELYKLITPQTFQEKIAVIGCYKSESRQNEKGERYLFQYFQPESIDYNIEHYKTRNNSIRLGGTICQPVQIKNLDHSAIYYSKIAVNTPTIDNYIPIYVRGRIESAEIIKDLKPGDRIEFLGRIQSRTYHVAEDELKRTHEVSLGSLVSVEYKDTNSKITYNEDE